MLAVAAAIVYRLRKTLMAREQEAGVAEDRI
jgi:hypothetical protein